MTSKESLERLSKYNLHYVKGNNYLLIDVESEEWKIILKGLERLEQIDNANSSEALNRLENICKILNEKRIDIKWLFKEDYTTIKQALLKAQEQEKENELLKEIIKCLFDRGCPLHQYIDKNFGLTIEVDDECSIMQLGKYKDVDLNKKLKEVLDDGNTI